MELILDRPDSQLPATLAQAIFQANQKGENLTIRRAIGVGVLNSLITQLEGLRLSFIEYRCANVDEAIVDRIVKDFTKMKPDMIVFDDFDAMPTVVQERINKSLSKQQRCIFIRHI